MLTKIIIAVIVVLGGFLGYVAMQPADMRIERELVIQAPPEKIFPYINNPTKGNEWMPWSEIDSEVKVTYSGPEEGVQAASSWESPGKMGVGQSVIIESTPNQIVKTQLTYTKPMEMSQVSEISLTPGDAGTVVLWSVTGKNSFMGRLMCVFMDMDKEVGTQFEKGLNKLKMLVEGSQGEVSPETMAVGRPDEPTEAAPPAKTGTGSH